MKIKKIITLVIFMATLITNAQIKLTGVVKDSIGPLEMANVIALDTRLQCLKQQKHATKVLLIQFITGN